MRYGLAMTGCWKHWSNGCYRAPHDAEGLASAIRRVLEPDQWDQSADAEKRVALERSHEYVGLRLREVYDEVLS